MTAPAGCTRSQPGWSGAGRRAGSGWRRPRRRCRWQARWARPRARRWPSPGSRDRPGSSRARRTPPGPRSV